MSRGQDKRLRATFVLLGALLVEIYWLKFRVAPEFSTLYGRFDGIPAATRWVLGWGPYLMAMAIAPVALVLGLRGADPQGSATSRERNGIAALLVAAAVLAGLGVGVIWALYLPV